MRFGPPPTTTRRPVEPVTLTEVEAAARPTARAPVCSRLSGVVRRAREVIADPRKILRRVRESDPGLLRLTQALKTGLAVVIALAVLYRADPQTRLFSGVAAGFLMQCTSTGTRRRRQATMTLSAAAMCLTVVVAAGALAGHPLGQDALLLAVAFAAFYVRRFLPDQSLFPVFGFIICLLAAALPGGWPRAAAEVGAIAVGYAVAFVVHFYLLPPDPRRAFVDGLRIFAARAARLLGLLETALRRRAPPDLCTARTLEDDLVAGLAFNQQLVEQWGPALGGDPARRPVIRLDDATGLLLRQYEATHALSMLGGSAWWLTSADDREPPAPGCPDDLPPEAYAHLADLLADLRTRFERLEAGPRGDARALEELATGADDGGGADAARDRDLDALQAVVLEAHHPLCPNAAHLFSAAVAIRQLENLVRQIAQAVRREAIPPEHPAAETTADVAARASAPAVRPWADLRTPLRAAVSVGIALLIGHAFALERSYWAVLVAILLVNGTWGENTRRGLARFGWSVAGCVVAAVLLWLTGTHRGAQVGFMIVGVILAAYYRTTSFPLLTFFVTLYVVILFSLFGQSPARVVVVRTYETLIGCAVALVASVLVPPPRSTRQWEGQLAQVCESSRRVVARAFEDLLRGDSSAPRARPGADDIDDAPDVRDLMSQLRTLRTSFEAAAYEGVFSGPSRRRRRQSMDQARLLAHHALSLAEAVRAPHDPRTTRLLRDDLAALARRVLDCFPGTPDAPPRPPPADLDAVQEHLWRHSLGESGGPRLPAGELAWLGSVIYHARQICPALPCESDTS